MLRISDTIEIPESELELTAIRASGPGGQNVNKVSTAINLRFDIKRSRVLPEDVRERLLGLDDRRISAEGVVNIKARRSRSQEQNRVDALHRLAELIRSALEEPRPRKQTKPTKKAKEQRLADKAHRAGVKQRRGKIEDS